MTTLKKFLDAPLVALFSSIEDTTMKIGDNVTINSYHSTFHNMSGVVVEVVEDSVLKYTVKFDDDECYFSEEELQK